MKKRRSLSKMGVSERAASKTKQNKKRVSRQSIFVIILFWRAVIFAMYKISVGVPVFY